MASTFGKAFATGILDEATASMKGRRESLDAMTEQTLSVIPAAIAEKKKLEENQKIRRQKAENFLKINPSLGTLEMSMSFLNQFDPKNDQNVVNLSSVLQQVNFDNQQKLTQTKTLPPSVTLPSAQTGSNFLDRFRDPTIADALREGEKKLGLGTGDAEAALNFVNPANRPVDPNRFQLSGSGIFSPKALRDSTTRAEEDDLAGAISSTIGIGYNPNTSQFTPSSLLGNERTGGDDLALSILNASTDVLNYIKTTGAITGGTPISGPITQNQIDYSKDMGFIGGFINQFAAYNVRGESLTDFEAFKKSYININPMFEDVFDEALQGKVSYGAYNSVFKNATGKDIEYEDANGKMVSITVGNNNARPDFNVAQKLLLSEKKLDQKTINSMTQSQKEWDALEEKKLNALKGAIGDQLFNDMYLSIYGTGDFNTSYERIDDGLSSMGNYNIEENFLKNFGGNAIKPDTLIQHKQNIISGPDVIAQRDAGVIGNVKPGRPISSAVSEEEFDNELKKGLIIVFVQDKNSGRFQKRYLTTVDVELPDGSIKKAGTIIKEQ